MLQLKPLEEDWREPWAPALSVGFWVHVQVVLQELLLELAAWEAPVVPSLVAPFQVELHNWVEVEALVEFPACRMPSDPLLVLLAASESAQAVQAVL